MVRTSTSRQRWLALGLAALAAVGAAVAVPGFGPAARAAETADKSAAAEKAEKEKGDKGKAEAPAAAEGAWLTSLQEARALSKSTGRPILTNFTGSDWCGFCIKLKDEVFTKPEFQKWAASNVVLLEADFPRRKEVAADVKAQNEKLKEHYKVNGFPTVVVFGADGTEYGRMVGFGGVEEWQNELAAVMKKAPKAKKSGKSAK